MTDDDLLKGLRDAARREDTEAAPLGKPPGADARMLDRLTERALSELTAAPMPPRAPVVPLRSRRLRWAALAVPLAAAASLLLLLRPAPAELPSYGAEIVLGGERATRGAAEAPELVFRPSAPFELRLRPASRVATPVEARLYLDSGSARQPLQASIETTASGVLSVRGRLPATLASLEASQLLIVIAPAGVLPANLPSDPAAMHVQRLALKLRAAPR
jgi:hypothetical protein